MTSPRDERCVKVGELEKLRDEWRVKSEDKGWDNPAARAFKLQRREDADRLDSLLNQARPCGESYRGETAELRAWAQQVTAALDGRPLPAAPDGVPERIAALVAHECDGGLRRALRDIGRAAEGWLEEERERIGVNRATEESRMILDIERHARAALAASGEEKWRVRVEFKPQDCWIGAFWKPGHLWVCIVPMFPLHLSNAQETE